MTEKVPPELTPQARARLMELIAELEDAADNGDGNRGVEVLKRISAEVHPDIAEFMMDGLIDSGFARLSKRIGDDDPQAYTILRDMIAKFGPVAEQVPANSTQEKAPTVARFLTVGGAHVVISGSVEDFALTVFCEGCGMTAGPFHKVMPEDRPERSRGDATRSAQKHAETCRAVPERLWPN